MNEHLKIFGILHVKNALNLPENIEEIYDDTSERLEGYSIRLSKSNVPPINSAIERDKILRDTMTNSGFLNVVNSVLDGGGLYYGNDLSTFTGGSNWHRDSYNRLPLYKFAIYLEGSYGDEQAFIYVPGSHNFGDKFSNFIQEYLRWPSSSGLKNGLSSILDLNNSEDYGIQPSVIKINRGDVVVFDIRLMHAVISQNIKTRRLISTIFMPDFNMAINEDGCGNFLNTSEYELYLLKHRCASHVVEKNLGRKIYSSQFDLNINSSEYKNILYYNKLTEEEIDKIAVSFYGNGEVARARALKFLCNA